MYHVLSWKIVFWESRPQDFIDTTKEPCSRLANQIQVAHILNTTSIMITRTGPNSRQPVWLISAKKIQNTQIIQSKPKNQKHQPNKNRKQANNWRKPCFRIVWKRRQWFLLPWLLHFTNLSDDSSYFTKLKSLNRHLNPRIPSLHSRKQTQQTF